MGKQLIYSVYFILPVLLLWGAKPAKKGEWNDGLSLEQTKAFQGFLTICIMLHHIGQKTCASWLFPKSRIIPGLEFFVPIGYILVSFFLFFNGYGAYKSFHTKENYLNGFVKKRVLPVVLALYSTTVIFFIARLLVGEKMDVPGALLYLSSIKLCNPNTWYVIVLPFFYLAFYFSFMFIKKDGFAVFSTTAFVVLYMLLGTRIDHNDYLIRGEWWWNCVHMFPIGIIFAKYENKIIPHLKKYYWVYAIAAVLALYPLYLYSCFAQDFFSYYGENFFAPDKVMRRRLTLLSQVLVTTDFVFAALLLGMKVKIGNRFLKFMGTITLEFYLIHGLFVELCDHTFDGGVKSPFPIRNVFLYVLVVFAFGVPSAILLKKLHGLILGTGKRKAKEEILKKAS
ncbi:acyltransferase family protein [Butyrivibrio sp. AE3004]|uniref:acyltransferase family protein n=1 Tax=Butyrivibrio sp. AE3004 TaxID=1506994 RepID=UPI000494AC08|nr:acyltransferase [Butyrivibrio sp. AE3004]